MTTQTYSKKRAKEMIEKGIYRGSSEDTFASDSQIKRDLALKGELPVLETPMPTDRDFSYWSGRFRKRQADFQETATPLERQHVEISFSGDTIINFIGDTHVGAVEMDYERLEREIEVINNTPDSYIIFVGDLVDGFFFTPAVYDALEQTQEQWAYVDAMFKHLTKKRKILLGFGGDHDGWPKKMGIDPYYKFARELGAYYMQGVGHLTAKVDDQTYTLTGAHKLPGHSIRDNTWASKRASAEIQGADIYFSAHTHKKGHSLQAIKEFGNKARKVHFISIGPYKSTDEFSRKHGWAQQSPEEMYGCAIKLSADKRKIQYFDSILEANK